MRLRTAFFIGSALALLLGRPALAFDADRRALYPALNVFTFLASAEMRAAVNVTPGQYQSLQASEQQRKIFWQRYSEDLGQIERSKLSEAAKNARHRMLETQCSADMFRSYGEVLRPEQVKRMKQIVLQIRGMEVFDHPEVREALKISDKEVRELQGAYGKLALEMSKQLRADIDAKKITREQAAKIAMAMTNSVPMKVRESLSKEQKRVLEELLGEKYIYK
jgi:hypothetical protein